MSGAPGIPGISAELWDSLIPIDADAAEPDPTPTVVTTVPTTPTPTPAASYQQYQTAYSHYQQPSAYQTSYQHQQYASPAPQQQQHQQTVNMARQAIANSQQANAGAFDTADVATLNDAIGSAGVDLRAEEESLQRSHQTPSYSGTFEDRSRKQPLRPAFDPAFLGARMRTIGANYKVGAVPDECVTYLALALRARLQDLVTEMIDAARHRTREGRWDRAPGLYEGGGPAEGEGWTGPGAAWSILVRSDVAKQLAALEKVERAEEERERERRERHERATTAALTAVLNGEDPPQIPGDDHEMDLDPPERPPRKRAVSDEAGRRMAVNAAANRAAGTGRKYTWLTVGARPQQQHQPGGFGVDADAAPPPPKPRPYKSGTPPPLPPDAGADPRMRITLRDAMFVVEKERGHGGGRGAARGWT